MECDILTLPGLGDSGAQHWQSLWERRHPEWTRVTHRDWTNPTLVEWVAELDAGIAACEGPPILVAHGLACALVAHWAQSHSQLAIAGAMLVAPSDVEAASFPKDSTGFAPIPRQRLRFPSIVVASSNDEFVSPERAGALAAAWGSRLVDVGRAGHINAASGHGPWPEGEQLLNDFCAQIRV